MYDETAYYALEFSYRSSGPSPLTGMLVHFIEGCAYQIRYLLTHPEFAAQLGRNGREHVKENFLMTTDVGRWLLLLRILFRSHTA